MKEVVKVADSFLHFEGEYSPPLPFSQRPPKRKDSPPQEAPSTAMDSEGREENSDATPTRPLPPVPPLPEWLAQETTPDTPEDEEDLTTPSFPDTVPAPVRNSLALLSPDEMSLDEVRHVRMMMTAFYYAHQIRHPGSVVKKPEPYYERFYFWKVIFQELIVVAVMAIVTIISGLLTATGVIPDDGRLTVLLVTGGAYLLCVWFGVRQYWAWANTHVFSDLSETGLKRPLSRWLLLTEINTTLSTRNIQNKKSSRGWFTSLLNLNSWRVYLDTPAQDDDIFQSLSDKRTADTKQGGSERPKQGRGFIRDGQRLKKTVVESQNYLDQLSQ